jgi:hypothetical protein
VSCALEERVVSGVTAILTCSPSPPRLMREPLGRTISQHSVTKELSMNIRANILAMTSILLFMVLFGCHSGPDFEVLKSEILELHRSTIDAHLNNDVDFLVQNLSDGFMSVSNGEIEYPTEEELRSEFSSYLNNTTFSEYADLREPIIGFSRDGSVAWSIVQVKVAGKRKADDGTERDLDFTCAWITLYQREGDRWVKLAEVSNFK